MASAVMRGLRAVKDLLKPVDLLAETGPLPLLAFSQEGKMVSSGTVQHSVLEDKRIGGFSEGSFRVVASDGTCQEEGGPAAGIATHQGIGIFSGSISTELPADRPEYVTRLFLTQVFAQLISANHSCDSIKRIGYCALKFDWKRPLRIESQAGLQLRVKTDGREYITNMQVESFVPDELYQGFIRAPKNQWVTIRLPFDAMMLTRYGCLGEDRALEPGGFDLESFGFMVADGQNGPFRLEIEHITAVPTIPIKPAKIPRRRLQAEKWDQAARDP